MFNLLCKLGLHKYIRSDYMLTCSIYTRVKCERCGHILPSSTFLSREQADKVLDEALKRMDKSGKKLDKKLKKVDKIIKRRKQWERLLVFFKRS